jgi:hypothetical protein
MPPHLDIKLPADPVKRLEAFAMAVFGPRWRKDLAAAAGETHRVVKYWSAGHCPPDLDARLLRAANTMIAEQHRRAGVLKALRDQLEQGEV